MAIPADYRISLDPSDLQLKIIHGFLSRTYWSPGIPLEVVAQAAYNSLVAGAYHASGTQVGFARMITDHATFGYLADVFVLEGHRGKGLARMMTRSILDLPNVRRFRRIMLATRDAHGVYEACGFERVTNPDLLMQIVRMNGHGTASATPVPSPLPPKIPVIRAEEPPEGMQGAWPLPGLTAAFYRALRMNRM